MPILFKLTFLAKSQKIYGLMDMIGREAADLKGQRALSLKFFGERLKLRL